MFTVIIIMSCGMAVGFALRNREKLIKKADPVITWSIFILLFLLGISVGTNELIIKNLYKIGIKAVILTAGALAGSVICSFIVYKRFFKKDEK